MQEADKNMIPTNSGLILNVRIVTCIYAVPPVHSEANARRIAIVESSFGSAGVVSFYIYKSVCSVFGYS